jgi:serine/threonine protein kinase
MREDRKRKRDSLYNYNHRFTWLTNLFRDGCNSLRTQDLPDAYAALKCLYKYSLYLDNLESHNVHHTIKFSAWTEWLKNRQYSLILCDFDRLFSDDDWQAVHQYFAENPEEIYAGSKNNLMYSYLNSSQGIIRRNIKELNSGVYGRVTFSTVYKKNSTVLLTKRQSSSVNTFDLDDCKLEAFYNQQLGMGHSELLVRIEHGGVYKVYQCMYHMGEPIIPQLVGVSFSDKLSYAIQLLLIVRDLHSGKQCPPCVHRDIKPDNVLLDVKKQKVNLIDFGFVLNKDLVSLAISVTGTREYLPSYVYGNRLSLIASPNRFIDDLIATLRTIYYPDQLHPKEIESIFSRKEFDKLPIHLKSILDTVDVEEKIKMNHWTLNFVLASLIIYSQQKKITEEDINLIAQDQEKQDQIINAMVNESEQPVQSMRPITIDYGIDAHDLLLSRKTRANDTNYSSDRFFYAVSSKSSNSDKQSIETAYSHDYWESKCNCTTS